ncbi:MAG: hypothetical protein EOO70_06105 [Myxococcaceae bacterium]|nr:MAG: hypothetical protein EOO70_06105 [Myxococcaceae bacterium]
MPLSEKYPGTQFRGFWLQQTLGFEVGVAPRVAKRDSWRTRRPRGSAHSAVAFVPSQRWPEL